jgi:hypothetical protein
VCGERTDAVIRAVRQGVSSRFYEEGRSEQQTRQHKKKPEIVVSPSPFDFEEPVKRVLAVKPPTKRQKRKV